MKNLVLIIIIISMLFVPAFAQNGGYTASNYTQPYNNSTYPGQNQNNVPLGSVQPFQGLDNAPVNPGTAYQSPYQNYQPPPDYQNTQPYQSPNYQFNGNAQPYQSQGYPPANNAQFYQNPNYPLQGSMRIDRNAIPSNAYNSSQPPAYVPNNGQPSQNFNYPSNNPPPYQNYSQTNNPAPAPNVGNYYGSAAPNNIPPTYAQQNSTGQPPFGNATFPSPNSIPVASRHQATELINTAYNLSHVGNNEQAIELLKQAQKLDPSSAVVHLDLAAAYIALKQYDEALQESTIVLQMNPEDEKSYLNYLAAAIGANHMQDALRVGNEYLKRFPNGQNRTSLSNEMVAVEQELGHRANARGVIPPAGAPDNYLFYVTPNGKRIWSFGIMPLKVYVNSGVGYNGFVPEFETALINSFMTWQNATRGMVRFVPVDNPRLANIECKWTDSAANVSLAAEAGEAKVESVHNAIYHVTITLLTCRPEDRSQKLTNSLMQQVCLHEIGHALGIDGHSDKATDIMFSATSSNVEHPQLTQRDLNTLFLLYD